MSINSAPINSIPINGAASGAGNDVSINEILTLGENLDDILVMVSRIAERLSLIDTTLYPINTSIALSEFISFADKFSFSLDGTLSDSLILSPALAGEIHQIEKILDALIIAETPTSTSDRGQLVSEIIYLLDRVDSGIRMVIAEIITLTDSLDDKGILANLIIELINVDDISASNRALYASLVDALIISEDSSTTAEFSALLEDIVRFIVTTGKNTDFIAYLLATETSAVSTYTNYNFTGTAILDNQLLMINENGLYKQEGATDLTEEITARIQTAAMDWGTSYRKRCLHVYIGLVSDGGMILKVSPDGRQTAYYEIKRQTDNLQTQRITLGKGLSGKYWQFELITESDFDLESLDFMPVMLSRRI